MCRVDRSEKIKEELKLIAKMDDEHNIKMYDCVSQKFIVNKIVYSSDNKHKK
jgi:hypothetical protein